MDYREVVQWLKDRGYINDDWAVIFWHDKSLYCRDEFENTTISVFNRIDGELICYVGCARPNASVGGPTGIYVTNPWDVIDYFVDHLEEKYADMMKKVSEQYEI